MIAWKQSRFQLNGAVGLLVEPGASRGRGSSFGRLERLHLRGKFFPESLLLLVSFSLSVSQPCMACHGYRRGEGFWPYPTSHMLPYGR